MEGSYIDKWEVLKMSVKEFSISFSVKHQRIYKKIISDIENELNEIENLPHTLIDMNSKRDLESRLNNFMMKQLEGHKFARERNGFPKVKKKPTKFFLGLEKSIRHITSSLS